MAAVCAFSVKGVQAAANTVFFRGGNRVLDKARFVRRVAVNRHLHVKLIGHIQAVADRCRGRAQSSCSFRPMTPALTCSRSGQAGISLAQKAQIHCKGIGCLQHSFEVPLFGRAGGAKGASA